MNSPNNHKSEVIWVLSNIAAGSPEQIDLLFENANVIEMLADAFECGDHRMRKETGWTVANALTGASNSRLLWLCGTHILSVIPELLCLPLEPDLVERTLFAIESLVAKLPTYVPVIDSYEIFTAVHHVILGDYSDDDTIKVSNEN
ncbi:unnamed protein product [Gongylonema pulchrum]|uniref:Importin subunit alpha-1-like n=1 Tax=Gongylonema pulchrum TaxID=637853 RepID=A0A183D254_9BILA|nr:unnamed protein product [Gongylonema pulchrum]VDK37723.1 unnamed protein product [Gongylonema pulchrum]